MVRQPLITLPGHEPYYRSPEPAHSKTLQCRCGWKVTRKPGEPLVDDWHAHLDDVIRRAGREP
jgi:hypothetical protein